MSEHAGAICRRCRAPLSPVARFCPRCGAPTRAHERATARAANAERAASDRAVLVLAAGFVGVLVALVLPGVLAPDLAAIWSELLVPLCALLLVLSVGGWSLLAGSCPSVRHPGSYLLVPVVVAVTVAAAVAWVWLLQQLVPLPAATSEPTAMVWLVAVVMAPVAEEWICRGLLWQPAVQLAGPRGAVLVTAVLFAMMHLLNGAWMVELPHRFVSGVAFGWLRLRSGGLLPPVLAHALHNAAAVLLP